MLAVIRIPLGSTVFILEDDRDRMEWFEERLKGCEVHHRATAGEAIAHLAHRGEMYDLMFLDHDLAMEYGTHTLTTQTSGTGYQVAQSIVENNVLADATIIHSWNPDGAANMARVLDNAVVIPFGQFDVKIV